MIESDGVSLLGVAVRDSQFLKRLNLAGNAIGSYGLGAFAMKGLRGNVSLQELVLDSNDIGDEGLVALVASLGAHPSLVELSLFDNAIGMSGLNALAAALSKKTLGLHRLNLARNCLQKDAATPLASLLSTNETLLSLDVSDNALGGSRLDTVIVLSKGFDGMSMLAESLAANKTLLSLIIAGNAVGKAGMRAFSDMLAVNKSLRRVIFDEIDQPELESGLKRNTAVVDMGPEPPANLAALLSRNVKERDAFLDGVRSNAPFAKLKATLEKGIDIECNLLEGASAELVSFYHTIPRVRNYLFSSMATLDAISSMDAGTIKALAKENDALHFASKMGHVDAVKVLLQNGADPHQMDTMERTPLVLAIEYGHVNVVLALMQHKVDPKLCKFRLPLVLLAARNGHADVVELLVGRFPKMMDAKSAAPKSRSALHVAAKMGRARVCSVLLELGADPNLVSGDGFCPLHLAATAEVCQLLLNAGAFVNILSSAGKSALYYALFPEVATEPPNLDVVTFLVDNHAGKSDAFHAVTSLDLRNLYRDHLPVWIGQLPNLTSLKVVEGNTLRSIPRNVVESGDEGVLDYLRDMGSGTKDVWKSFKIMVLGKEGVGKTHIFHLASRSAYPRDASTDGIDIHTFELGKAQVPVTWFDFGGQEVFLPTHELFLTGQCVYLLAFKMTETEYAKRIMYWLKVVTSFSMDRAKVVIVGTHRDKLPRGDADVEAINKKVCQLTADSTTVVDKIYISCIDDPEQTGNLISEALLTAAKHANLTGKEVPHIYSVIKEWIADQKAREKLRPYFAWDAFVESFPGYDSFVLERACEFLHDMGVLFLAKRSIGNKQANLVCIDIQWLAKAFSAVITFRHSWVRNGVLHQEALSHIWRDFGIVDIQDMLAIMSLFEKFNIAFAQRQDGCWVIPSMLTEVPPALLSELLLLEEVTHARQYRLSVVPSGAFGQIMARVSEWADVTLLEMWRFGFVLRDAQDVAMVTVENGCDLFLRICKAGADPTIVHAKGLCSLLRRIDEELQQIFRFLYRRLNTMPVETLVLCPHCIGDGLSPADGNWIKYNEVVKLVLTGEGVFLCGEQEVPLPLLGEDLTLGYVPSLDGSAVTVEKTPLTRGGFGMIYRGEMEDGTQIVVKELIMGQKTSVNLFIDFQHEVSLMAQLHHPNLVRLHGVMFCPLRMVLELCAEGDLLHAIADGKLASNTQLKYRIATDVAEGMNFLHSQAPPLAHRDLRSPNVLLVSLDSQSSKVVAKVADFGLTAASSGRLQLELETWQWMAPETFMGENYTESCDLYSFGMVLWEIFTATGEIPFENLTIANNKKHAREFMSDIIHKNLRPTFGAGFPADLTDLISRLWEKDPEARPSFAACLEVLNGSAKGIKREEGFLSGLVRKQRIAKPSVASDKKSKTKRATQRTAPTAGGTKSGWGIQRSFSALYTAPEKNVMIGSKNPRARTSVSVSSTSMEASLMEADDRSRRRTVQMPEHNKSSPKPLPKRPSPRGMAPSPTQRLSEARSLGAAPSGPPLSTSPRKKPMPTLPSSSPPSAPARSSSRTFAPKSPAPVAPAPLAPAPMPPRTKTAPAPPPVRSAPAPAAVPVRDALLDEDEDDVTMEVPVEEGLVFDEDVVVEEVVVEPVQDIDFGDDEYQ